jgi:hypothetical protein
MAFPRKAGTRARAATRKTKREKEKLREKRLSDIDKTRLDQKLSKQDCKLALRSMADDKSPGPDKLPAEFYKQYEELILENFYNMLTEACEYGFFPEDTTEGTIALLYKHKT